jgi:hypothetical protein
LSQVFEFDGKATLARFRMFAGRFIESDQILREGVLMN